MKNKFILFFTLFACGADESNKINCTYEFKAGGLNICSEDEINPDEIEYAVQIVQEKTAEKYPQVVDLKNTLSENNTKVYFINDNLNIDCEKIKQDIYRCHDNMGGINIEKEIYVIYNNCLGKTAFAHEILHSIEIYYLSDVAVGGHQTVDFFTQTYGVGAVEHKIWTELMNNLESCKI